MAQLFDGTALFPPQAGGSGRAASVLFISDVRLYCEALAFSLSNVAEVSFAGHCGLAEALDRLSQSPIDVALIDTSLPEALLLARPIRARHPAIATLGLAMSGDPERVLDCAEAGFTGCIAVDTGLHELAAMIAGAGRGELACSPRVAGRLFERLASLSAGEAQVLTAAAKPAGKAMTQREAKIAELIQAGLTNKEIARKLQISAATVKNHVHNLLEKLAVPRRAAISSQIGTPGPQ